LAADFNRLYKIFILMLSSISHTRMHGISALTAFLLWHSTLPSLSIDTVMVVPKELLGSVLRKFLFPVLYALEENLVHQIFRL